MYKSIDTTIFKFDVNCKVYVVDMYIDSMLLDITYDLGHITLYFHNSTSTSKVKRQYEIYAIGDVFDSVNLKQCDKSLLINNQLYFLFERFCDA